MHDSTGRASRRVLDPMERTAEILFGLIMALSFTGTIEVATAGRDEIDPVLYAAVGCNIAWGLVDAVMYVVQSLAERSRRLGLLRSFVGASSDVDVRAVLAAAVPAPVVPFLGADDLAALRAQAEEHLRGARVRVTGGDLLGAAAVFLLVVLATFPVVIPYLVLADAERARRTSNVVAIAMLYACGHVLGRYALGRPVRLGLAMVAIGVVLVGTTIALGG